MAAASIVFIRQGHARTGGMGRTIRWVQTCIRFVQQVMGA
ncbi:hypothetical protein V466_15545 [Pseudomonas mandelii PD30]|uniref:Uncharacterized protein n=1 Tax=Pseudomonas mandelii PD30 TaxID=1419583 RepID=A0A059L2G7_9PSED|nr:hypothetical protein V466_15545 [Pseudomonas mandelii PD30]